MPTYRFRNMNSGKEYDKFMSNDEREKYLKTHSIVAQVPQAIAIVGDHIMGVGPKTDAGFEDRMSQIAAAHPSSPLASKYKSNESHAKIKARSVIEKHKKKRPLIS